MITAGAEKLIVVAPDHNVSQRWSLSSFPKELTKTIPIMGVVKAIAMGYASDGPLLMNWAVGVGALDRTNYTLYDIDSLEPVKLEELKVQAHGRPGRPVTPDASGSFRLRNSSYRDRVHIRASGSGDVFGLWCSSHSPAGLETFIVRGRSWTSAYEHTTVGHIVPNADGSVLCTARGIYTLALKRKYRDPPRDLVCIPSCHPKYYITAPQVTSGRSRPRPAKENKPQEHGSVFVVESRLPLVSLPKLEEMSGIGTRQRVKDDFTLEKRYHFIPQANLLITIPPTDDRLVIRRFNLKDELKKAGIDYLFVDSTPKHVARPGGVYNYQIRVESKHGGVKFALTAGPDRMTLSPSGSLTWRVPLDSADHHVGIVVTVSDASGQEIFHSFTIDVRDK